jgi:hypothetical protein
MEIEREYAELKLANEEEEEYWMQNQQSGYQGGFGSGGFGGGFGGRY